MRRFGFFLALLFLYFTAIAGGADLDHIDRTIGKEPAYRAKPSYCLLVLGPQARTRVWVVRDGLTLYVDRNGDGDLTQPGKRVEIAQHQHGFLLRGQAIAARQRGDHAARIEYDSGTFYCPELVDADDGRYTNFVVFLQKTRSIVMFLKTPNGWTQGASADLGGDLRFADSPQDAPVIHFGGPLTMAIANVGELFPEFPDGQKHLYAATVGTPGRGPGTFASVQLTGIPEGIWPVAEIEFPRRPGEPAPQRQHVDLLTRC